MMSSASGRCCSSELQLHRLFQKENLSPVTQLLQCETWPTSFCFSEKKKNTKKQRPIVPNSQSHKLVDSLRSL